MTELVGHILREAREARGCTLEDAEKATRIRAKYLAALEADDFAALPAPAQARGFLRNYARFLELNTEQMLTFYDAQRHRPHLPFASRAPQASTAPGRVTSRRPRLFSSDIFVALVFTAVLGLLLLWGAFQFAPRFTVAATATSTRPVAVPIGTAASATPTSPADEATPTPPLPPPRASYSGVNLLLQAEQRTWVRVLTDGTEVFAGQLVPGDSKEFAGQNQVEVTTGNGRGLRIIWNGRDQGTLGQVGEVVTRIWTLTGAVTPTPTITPTPGETSTLTPTPNP